jgi:uncharacterized protein YecT (DUF1311 family)
VPAFALLALLGTLQTAGAQPPPCPVQTTPGVETSLAERLRGAEAEMNRYLDAALARVQRDTRSDPRAAKALAELRQAQQAWSAWRETECGAVYDYWSGGTIRGAKSLSCTIDLTRLRTHTIWSQWLTYVDNTPPILPEPAVPPTR